VEGKVNHVKPDDHDGLAPLAQLESA